MLDHGYELHRLGWKAFQDLCVAIAEERLQRPVQTFLPSGDAGRDGAFLGSWDQAGDGESTIQCKFSSKPEQNLTLSMLSDELPKARRLAEKGLAKSYIILTNCGVTGESELQIKVAFQQAGVGVCRVFHRDWIVEQIRVSPRLRMMVPRLYGLVDLSAVLDARAYRQAQLILSEMGDSLQKLVVTEAHRKSVRAISRHSLVLLLGSPAAGKSTIGASLALGANDIWKCTTIKSSSPEHLEAHLDTDGNQFFWVDDAWGSTQYQRERTEKWNQIFPLMQGAMSRGTRFLITSRDYIWQSAKKELKLQAMPVLKQSQVIIDVHELTSDERAKILYNHVKLGDQDAKFRAAVKPFLPAISNREDFLPESARRLGSKLFTKRLQVSQAGVLDFFARPMEFLEETLESLAPESRAAIALIFLNGGQVRSPVATDIVATAAASFGAPVADVRAQLEALDGSLLNLVFDDQGPYWTYRHPTISDAFASYVAKSPELIEIYLRGARPETILREVVCAGADIAGAHVVVPTSMYDLLLDRIAALHSHSLARFISYRSSPTFSAMLMGVRPDIWDRLEVFTTPLREDSDVDLLTALHQQGLLPEDRRARFVDEVRSAAVEYADDSLVMSPEIRGLLTDEERKSILSEVRSLVLEKVSQHIERVKADWSSSYSPSSYFDELRESFATFANELADEIDVNSVLRNADWEIQAAIEELEVDYDPPAEVTIPTQQSIGHSDSLAELFRDIDE